LNLTLLVGAAYLLRHPRREFFAGHHASGERENHPFLIIQSSRKLKTAPPD